MIIYKDINTGDELLSDTYNIKDVGDGLWEVDLDMVDEGGEDFKLEGANASAEGEDADDTEASSKVKVINLVRDFRLQEFGKQEKKAYMAHAKDYMKATLAKMKANNKSEEDQKAFQDGAKVAIKKILANINNYDVFVGESVDPESMFVLIDYRADGITPYATFWKYGLTEMKV